MYKIKKIFVIFLILNCFNAYAQIRDFVGVLRSQNSPQLISYLKDFQKELNSKGYSLYANEIDNYLEGGFGSGFIYVDAAGNNYIVTNHHVIGDAETASLEFENPETAAVTKYENLKIIAYDDEIDIAILTFENKVKPFKKGLPISVKKITDGTEVYSAGFPGLAGNPLWQLGKGIVTNSSARIKDLLDPEISVLIQHSAEVDPGNSGGPLLITSNNTVGYEVVGINTWKANYRQNTNFAIPSKVILDLIENGKLPTKEERSEKIKTILENQESDFTELAKYVSIDSVLENGSSAFIDVLKYAPTVVRNTVVSVYGYSPVEAMKYAIAYDLKNSITPKKDNSPDYSTKKNSEIVKFMGIESNTKFDIDVGMFYGFGNIDLGTGLTGGFVIWPYDWVGMEINVMYCLKDKLLFFNIGPSFRIPLNFNKFTVSPFTKFDLGMSFGGDEKYTQGRFEGGIEMTFSRPDNCDFGFGLSYSYLKLKPFGVSNGKFEADNSSSSNIGVYGKICF